MNKSPLSLVQSLMIITKPLISVLFLYFFFIFSSLPSPSHCNVDDSQSFLGQCSRPYECGNITNISYPFWGGSRPQYCGHPEFELRCITYSKDQYPVIEINGLDFRILNINGSNGASGSLRIARLDLWDGLCSSKVRLVNTTLNYNLFFDSAPTVNDELSLFYNCTQPPNYLLLSLGDSSTCGAEMTEIVYYANQTLLESLDSVNLKACENVVQVPVLRAAFDHHEVNALAAYQSGIFTFSGIDEVLNQGFQVEYNKTVRSLCEQCERSGGTCGSDNTTLKFLCFCRDNTHDFACTGNGEGLNWKVKAAI
ncbi:Wall-associated receptor kinase, C-terminal, partial [Trema orientale]